ncbi:glycerophosphoinositol inositolphosphodiesterase GDPD2 [Hoplias malabaricus]|uniref:glycerophosphoinositol inositolphosphodiesterase GDPD2 n=1 Tax=Hoplias malabaricus TaxID=27720 RepID=UPI003461E877
MRSQETIFRICLRGINSCNWNRKTNKKRYSCCWFSFLALVSSLALVWLYICFIAYNEHNDFNGKFFQKLSFWVNWYMVIIIVSAVLAIYCLLLLIFSLFQFAIKEPLDLHWFHKVFLILGLIIVVIGTAAISLEWKEEWSTVRLSLQATAPFLQLGAVVALTLVSWLVFHSYHKTQSTVSKVLIIGALLAVSTGIFISPLWINSPCVIETLYPKPALVGHRGAPVLAPENTMMSFKRSMECNVTAFETDVQLSKDKTPFLMHDHGTNFLKRTTNADVIFPNRMYNQSTDWTWQELQMLNAGEWFIKNDPFWSVSLLSKEERQRTSNQTVPSLSELLDLAKEHNIPIIFDSKNDNDDCSYTVETILNSGISRDLIWLLPKACREYANKHGQRFQQVYSDASEMEAENGTFLNMKYNSLSAKDIREYRRKNVRVNMWVVNESWLFSLLWCSGVSSVTTNSCHLFRDMSQPDWHLTPLMYNVIWITVDLVSLFMMVILFLLQRRKKTRNQSHLERDIPLLKQSISK